MLKRLARSYRYRLARRQGVTELENHGPLGWMGLVTPGMLHPGQKHLLDLAIGRLPSEDPVVEIGSWCGMSASVIAYLLVRHNRPNAFFTSDPWIFEGEEGEFVPGTTRGFNELRGFVREEFKRHVSFWAPSNLPASFDLSSDDFFRAWRAGERRVDVFGSEQGLGGPISLCLIDGDHELEQARRDFTNADEFLIPGGFILMDDSDEFGAFPHLYDLVQTILATGRYELIAANPHHLLKKLH